MDPRKYDVCRIYTKDMKSHIPAEVVGFNEHKVLDPTELVQPGGNNHSSRFVRLSVGACFIHGAG